MSNEITPLQIYFGRRPLPPKQKPRERRDGPLQAELIPLLLQTVPGSATHGWRAAALEAFADLEEVQDSDGDFKAALDGFALMPDAYVIHKDTSELHFFEVEVRHLLTNAKMRSYAVFLTILDYYGISFGLFSVNQHGHINQVDLLPHYVDWIKEQQQK